jgi:hypothetical protein
MFHLLLGIVFLWAFYDWNNKFCVLFLNNYLFKIFIQYLGFKKFSIIYDVVMRKDHDFYNL